MGGPGSGRKPLSDEGVVGSEGEVREKLNELKSDYEAEVEEKKKKKRRKRAADKPDTLDLEREQAKAFANERIVPVVVFLMEAAAKRMPNPIPPTDFEKEFLSSSISSLAVKYASSFIKLSEEIAVLTALGIFITPRLKRERKRNEGRDTSPGENGKREKHFGEENSEQLQEKDNS